MPTVLKKWNLVESTLRIARCGRFQRFFKSVNICPHSSTNVNIYATKY
jgi:hypothetical protein